MELYASLLKDIEDHPTDNQYFLQFGKSFHQFALDHQKIIQRFGRYPHRNDTLGRTATQEEIDYLANGGQRF